MNFWTRTDTNATRIAVNNPCEPRPAIVSVCSFTSTWINRNTTVASTPLVIASCLNRFPRSYAIAKHTNTASIPNVAVTGTCSSGRCFSMRASHPGTGRYENTMNIPPMIVSGTTVTIPVRMADM